MGLHLNQSFQEERYTITDSVYERYHIVRKEDQQAALARVGAGLRGSCLSYLHNTPLKPAQASGNPVNAGATDAH